MFTSYPPRLVAGEELRRLRVGFSNSCALFGRKHHRSANMSACWFLRHGQGRGGTQALYNSSMGCRKPVRGAVTRPPIVRKDPPPRRHSRPPGTPLTRNSAGFAGFTAVQTGPGQTPEQKNKIKSDPARRVRLAREGKYVLGRISGHLRGRPPLHRAQSFDRAAAVASEVGWNLP